MARTLLDQACPFDWRGGLDTRQSETVTLPWCARSHRAWPLHDPGFRGWRVSAAADDCCFRCELEGSGAFAEVDSRCCS